MTLLQIQDLKLSFAGVRALDGVCLELNEGEVAAVIGPNGAGKTSLFNCISGLYQPQEGEILFGGKSLRGLAPYEIASSGIARTFQNLALFEHLTVLENLQLGRHHLMKTRWWNDIFFTAKTRREETRHRYQVEEVIEFLDLARYRAMPAGILSYGVLKKIELGRALCMEPKLLLLDEPAAGLNQEATEDLARCILDIKEELGITLLLIEHDMRFVMQLADSITVLVSESRLRTVNRKMCNNIRRYYGIHRSGGDPVMESVAKTLPGCLEKFAVKWVTGWPCAKKLGIWNEISWSAYARRSEQPLRFCGNGACAPVTMWLSQPTIDPVALRRFGSSLGASSVGIYQRSAGRRGLRPQPESVQTHFLR